jgi:hypothetical protein
MRFLRMRSLLVLLVAFVCAHVTAAVDGPPFDFRLHLAAVHPEIYGNAQFRSWNTPIRLARWTEEERTTDDKQVVFVQTDGPPTGSDTLAFRIQYHDDGSKAVLDVIPFSASEVNTSYVNALNTLKTRSLEPITSAELMIDLASPVPLGWRLGISARIFDIRGAVIEAFDRAGVFPLVPPHDCSVGGDDSESENDLHHPNDATVLAEASRPVKNNPALSLQEQAEALCDKITRKVRFTTDDGADYYTDSDALTRARNGGACDEKAVLLVTYLRSLGIPARMKFLRWSRGNDQWAHACVEYVVKNTVHYLDPTLGFVDAPESYRGLVVDGYKVQDLKVVDVDWPADARSTTPVGAAQLPDSNSQDGRLNPWGDFCYSPRIEGEIRDRYSRDAQSVSLFRRFAQSLSRTLRGSK